MNDSRIIEYLNPASPAVQSAMLADASNLAPGAAAVVGRFFTEVRRRREPLDAPGPGAFSAAAQSESTLATLLRALHRYAPNVSTAAGRDLRKSYYRRRSGAGGVARQSRTPAVPLNAPDNWPSSWREMWRNLRSSAIRDSSKMRYLASITRCANMLRLLDLPPGVSGDVPGYFVAIMLGDAFIETGVRPITASGYLDGLVALMRAGDAEKQTLDGLRAAREHFKSVGRRQAKLKTGRIRRLRERGGFECIIQTICQLRSEIDDLAGHAARTEKLRQTNAVLMLLVNKPARIGDIARWRLGHELSRLPSGEWTLDWCQKKRKSTPEQAFCGVKHVFFLMSWSCVAAQSGS